MIDENENTYGENILSQLLPPQDWGLNLNKRREKAQKLYLQGKYSIHYHSTTYSDATDGMFDFPSHEISVILFSFKFLKHKRIIVSQPKRNHFE